MASCDHVNATCEEPTMSNAAPIKGMGALPHAGGVAFRV
jgi:hypothetical protein